MDEPYLTRKSIWLLIKWAMFFVVLAFVGWHGWTLWHRIDAGPARWNWGGLTLATAVSIVAWLPSLAYWRWLLTRLGAVVPWSQAARAYYCGQLGKYLPGKGAVIVIRAALLKPAGVPATTAALAVTHETLTCMWAGGVSALVLYPSLAPHLPAWIAARADSSLLRVGWLAGFVCVGAAFLSMLVGSHRRLRGLFGGIDAPARAVPDTATRSLQTTMAGGMVFLAAWWIHGLTLGLTIRAVAGEQAGPWSDWPFWTGAAAVALVGGFVALFAPAGLGVREGLLMELLERQFGPRDAVLVTVLWRGVSLAGEILAAGILYYGIAEMENVPASQEESGLRS